MKRNETGNIRRVMLFSFTSYLSRITATVTVEPLHGVTMTMEVEHVRVLYCDVLVDATELMFPSSAIVIRPGKEIFSPDLVPELRAKQNASRKAKAAYAKAINNNCCCTIMRR